MKRGAWLRRRYRDVRSQLDKMMKRHDSAVALDDSAVAADAVAQHRAETEAKLEGKIKPLIPTSQHSTAAASWRNSVAARRSNGGARDSIRNSRQSFASQHFAMSAVTAGCGQGLGWSMADVHSSHQTEHFATSEENMFRGDRADSTGRTFFPRSKKRNSQIRYSVLDPSMGFGEGMHHGHYDAAHSEQANHIRLLMEAGNFDLHQFGIDSQAIDDPDFQTALHAALESFPPGMAANIIEAAAAHQEHQTRQDEKQRRASSSRKSRFSISFASKTAWADIRKASHRWSRMSSKHGSDIPLVDGARFSKRIWSRISWGRKNTDYMAF